MGVVLFKCKITSSFGARCASWALDGNDGSDSTRCAQLQGQCRARQHCGEARPLIQLWNLDGCLSGASCCPWKPLGWERGGGGVMWLGGREGSPSSCGARGCGTEVHPSVQG